MKIKQIITESAVVKSKAESILRILAKQSLLTDENSDKVVKTIASIVQQNPSTDVHQLLNMVKDKIGGDVDEDGIGSLSDKRLTRIATTKSRSYKKSLNALSNIISSHSGRFGKTLINKLKNPVAEDEGL